MPQRQSAVDNAVIPTYEEIVVDLTEAVQVAAALRQAILDAGFHASFAGQVANTFLWQSLGLPLDGDGKL